MSASIPFPKLEISAQMHVTWERDRNAEKKACEAESSELQVFFM